LLIRLLDPSHLWCRDHYRRSPTVLNLARNEVEESVLDVQRITKAHVTDTVVSTRSRDGPLRDDEHDLSDAGADQPVGLAWSQWPDRLAAPLK
jgi:hypothetical protein